MMLENFKHRLQFINGFTLKWIALITMAIDHTGMVLFPRCTIMRIVGRLAFPIYCFLLVEGAVHTSNWKRYLGRLFVFALISEIPFNLAVSGNVWYLEGQNVFFTLFLGLAAVLILMHEKRKLLSWILVLGIMFLARYTSVDYGAGGIFFIVIFYLFRDKLLEKAAAFIAGTLILFGGLETYAILSLAPILCYNGKRGPRMKYFFYLFYPAHLLILHLILCWKSGVI